jgi:hypothetical protein
MAGRQQAALPRLPGALPPHAACEPPLLPGNFAEDRQPFNQFFSACTAI